MLKRMVMKSEMTNMKKRQAAVRAKCIDCTVNKVRARRAIRCAECQEAFRRMSMKRNNTKWRKRKALGRAQHRVTYRGRLTEWAKAHPADAMRLARQLKTPAMELERLKKLLTPKLAKAA
jgi:hypothetical protein